MRERIRLLIIDENPVVREALAMRLQTMPDLDVKTVGAANEVRYEVERLQPDVVLIEPKRLNGEGFNIIRDLARQSCPPMIIVLTSYWDDTEEMVANELGITRYLLKDINSQALFDTIVDLRKGLDFSSGIAQ